jgi:hypothetical protein
MQTAVRKDSAEYQQTDQPVIHPMALELAHTLTALFRKITGSCKQSTETANLNARRGGTAAMNVERVTGYDRQLRLP